MWDVANLITGVFFQGWGEISSTKQRDQVLAINGVERR
jgi:hypothetical protein